MLTKKEIGIMKNNAKVHKKVFDEIKLILKDGTSAKEVDKVCGDIAKKHNVLCAFKGVYGFPNNICISVNDVVVHGRARKEIIFRNGDLVTLDFGIKDKQVGIYTDAAFSVIIGGDEKNLRGAKLIEINKKALYAGIEKCRVGNTTGDIGNAIEQEVKKGGFKVVRDLTGHAIGKKLHEKPYIYNYGTPGAGEKLKAGMVLAIEPILGETSGDIVDHGDWEIFIKDGSLGSQYEHSVLITDTDPEIII